MSHGRKIEYKLIKKLKDGGPLGKTSIIYEALSPLQNMEKTEIDFLNEMVENNPRKIGIGKRLNNVLNRLIHTISNLRGTKVV
jgi:hypothetical protein